MRSAVVAVVAAATVAVGSGAPQCRVYNNTLSDGTLGFCAGIVTYPYYAANDKAAQELLEDLAANVAFNEKRGLLAPLLGERCVAQLKATACLEVFPKCVTVDPFFVNTCQPCGATGTCAAGGSCAPKPGVQYGTANGAWSAASCAAAGFFFDKGQCLAALPQYPCKDTCLLAAAVDNSQTTVLGFNQGVFTNAACPLVSGPFVSNLQALAAGTDPDLAAQATGNLGGSATGTGRTTTPGLVTTNVLQLAGAAINCMGTVDVALSSQSSKPFGKHPKATQAALLEVLTANAAALGNNCGATDCAVIKQAAQCLPTAARGASTVQPSFDFADPNSVCAPVLAAGVNQDDQLFKALVAKTVLAQPTELAQANCASTKAHNLAYFLPNAAGMFPAPPLLDNVGGREFPLSSPFLDRCNVIPPGPNFGNLQGAQPLCTSKLTGRSGFNARDCLAIKVDDLNRQFPRFAPERCRVAFLEMMCGQTMMKLQFQSICFVGAVEAGKGCTLNPVEEKGERMALSFALPRFPAPETCQKFKDECGFFIAQSPVLSALRCDAKVGDLVSPRCENPALGTLFPRLCGKAALGALGALPQFPPNSRQQLISPDNLRTVLPEALLNAAPGLAAQIAASFTSSVSKPTISAVLYKDRAAVTLPELQALQAGVCLCPLPLLAPNDVLKSNTTIPNSCCQLPCEGTMLSKDQLSGLGIFSLVLNTIGILCALFMVLTWGGFESKRKQYITFWFSFCSLMVSIALWLLTVAGGGDLGKASCKDNTTPHSIAADGLSICSWQAVWLAYFSLAECAWWFIQALDLFRKIVQKTRESEISRRKYHLLAWFMPTVAVLVLLINQQAGFSGPTPFCFFAADTPSTVQYAIYFIPVMLYFVLGVFLMTRVLFTIRQHSAAMDQNVDDSSGNRKWAKQMSLYRTPITFVFMFVAVWIIIFAYRLTGTFNEKLFTEQGGAWVKCLLVNFAKGLDDPTTSPEADVSMLIGAAPGQKGCGTTQPGGISFPTTLAMFLAASSQSIAVFLIFGLKKENFSLWRQALGFEARKTTVQDSVSSLSKGSEFPPSTQGRVAPGMPGAYGSSMMTSSQAYGDGRLKMFPFQPSLVQQQQQQQQQQQYGMQNSYRVPQGSPPAPPSPYKGGGGGAGYGGASATFGGPAAGNQYKGGFNAKSGKGDFHVDDI